MLTRVLRCAKLMFPYKLKLFFFLTIGFIYGGINLGFVSISKFTINLLEKHDEGMENVLPSFFYMIFPESWLHVYPVFYFCIFCVVVLLAGLCIFIYFRTYIQQWFCMRISMDIRNHMAEKMLLQDYAFFSRFKKGDLISRMGGDLGLLTNAILQMGILITRPIQIVLMVIAVFWINWKLALYGMIGVPLAAVSFRYLSKRMRSTSRMAQQKSADVMETMMQFLQGIATVKAFGCEKFELENFRRENDDLFNVSMSRERAQARERPLVSFTSKIGVVIVMLIGGSMVIEHQLSYGDVVGFLAALGLMYEPGKELSRANAALQNALPGAERVFEILDQEVQTRDGHIEMQDFKKNIIFNKVNFSYVTDTPVLHDFSVNINKGETVALVGASGAGKSTIINLLLRFYDLSSGEILIDGVNLSELTFESLRKHVALVSQTPFLFNCSVRDNIAYGREDAKQEDIVRAAMAANVHEEIVALPQGYDTIVGDRGESLSGGQRQRVTIARAIFKNPPILLLDEATSALDSENERKVQDALDSLMQNRTSIVIAHRLSTILHADRIVAMEQGRIVGIGNHQELLQSCETYKRLAALQGLEKA